MTALAKLFRSTAFKLRSPICCSLSVFAVAMLVYVAWNATRCIDEQIRSTLEAEANGLVEQYDAGRHPQPRHHPSTPALAGPAPLYSCSRPSAARGWPAISAPSSPACSTASGTRDIDYVRSDDTAEGTPHRAKVQVIMLPSGFRLLVGRDLEERERLGEVIRRAFG